MKHSELIAKYLEFFKSKNHSIIPSASLIPENDPTVLFTTAGMHPLVPYLIGQPHPGGKRLADDQKSLRTDDIDEVGDAVHHTFFEMLGNWSLGDYFKKDAISWSFEFLTSKQCLGLPLSRLAVSCFAGDNDAPKDNEAADIWLSLGVSQDRIAFLPKKDNWWGPAGATGPCGPDTEMFYWAPNNIIAPAKFDPSDKRWVEIWNDVFMQYNKIGDGKFEPLKQQNVDTGMGVERATAVLQGFDDNYKTELFAPIIAKVEELSNKKYTDSEDVMRSMRIIADHIRAATFVLGDDKGVSPSNIDQGYIVRRLIRRSVRYAKKLGIVGKFCSSISEVVIDIYSPRYAELTRNRQFILSSFDAEEDKFALTLEKGLSEFKKVADILKQHNQTTISGKTAFLLYESHGFPYEFTAEMAHEAGLKMDREGFMHAFERHQETSRLGADQKFKSGLADNSVRTVKLHTATHLLQAALRAVVGEHIKQKGSNITPERLRFDFATPEKLSPEQIKQVEDWVNNVISKGIDIIREEMTVDEAKKQGAMGLFDSKYGEKVSVYTVPGFSKEICTGPHVKNTAEIGKFKILKEESIAAGVRRIKATVE